MRYLQQFAKSTANGDMNSLEEGQGATGSARPGSHVGMERYRSAYEESITPFEVFRGKVSSNYIYPHCRNRQECIEVLIRWKRLYIV